MTRSGAEAVGRLVLDTSAYSHFRSGDDRVLDLIAVAEIVFLPTIVLGELEAGFVLGRRDLENRTVLAEFLAEPFVSVLQVTPTVARHYGRLVASLRRAGTPNPHQRHLDCGDDTGLWWTPLDLRWRFQKHRGSRLHRVKTRQLADGALQNEDGTRMGIRTRFFRR